MNTHSFNPSVIVTFSQVYVLKRPHVDEFLRRVGELFECVLFTASLAKVCLLCIYLLSKLEEELEFELEED